MSGFWRIALIAAAVGWSGPRYGSVVLGLFLNAVVPIHLPRVG